MGATMTGDRFRPAAPAIDATTLAKLRRLNDLASAVKPSGNRAAPVMTANAPTLTYFNTSTLSTAGLATQWGYPGKFLAFGGIPTVASPGYVMNSRFFSPANGGGVAPDYWSVEAISEDSIVGFLFNMATGGGANGVRVQVDGQLVSATPMTTASGGYNILKIDFSALATPRAMRRIKIEGYGGGVRIVAFCTTATGIVYPTQPDPFKLMFVGDSVCDGTGADWNGDGYPRPTADLLGVTDFRVTADGGTGYITVSGTGKQNFQTRALDVIRNAPDMLVTCMSSNDYGLVPSTLAAAVTNYLNTIRAAFPTMPIVLFGSMWNDANLASAQAEEAAVAAAVAGRNDPLIVFRPAKNVVGTPTPIFGQGNTTSPSGTGNSDWAFNGTAGHPSTEGHLLIARFLAEGIRAAVSSWLSLAA